MSGMKSIRFPQPAADEMVRAILEGRKTVTRRGVKPQPIWSDCGMRWWWKGDRFWWRDNWDPMETITYQNSIFRPGDILYVRETFSPLYPDEKSKEIVGYMYKAETADEYDARIPADCDWYWSGYWKPSIHMPREAARIFLRVTNMRMERLQEITMDGMQGEGVIPASITGGQWEQWQREYMRPVWDSTIKKADLPLYGWEANPWVWAIEFERISREEAASEESVDE